MVSPLPTEVLRRQDGALFAGRRVLWSVHFLQRLPGVDEGTGES
jgi:hypothetical protein